jgi:hypothetical protein
MRTHNGARFSVRQNEPTLASRPRGNTVRSLPQSPWRDRYPRSRRESARVHGCLLVSVCVAAATILLLSALAKAHGPQTADTLSHVKRVYVGSLGAKQGATELHDKLIKRLRKARGIEILESPSEADAILTGTGEIWLKGHISTNPKPIPWSQQAVYGGYLSAELRGKDNAILWSYYATPGKFQRDSVTQDLVNRLAKQLLEGLHQDSASRR